MSDANEIYQAVLEKCTEQIELMKKEYGKQPIIFYALESVDKPYDGLSYKDFIKSTTPMEYDEAAKFRDEQIKKVK
jgi:hypothetical protein